MKQQIVAIMTSDNRQELCVFKQGFQSSPKFRVLGAWLCKDLEVLSLASETTMIRVYKTIRGPEDSLPAVLCSILDSVTECAVDFDLKN